MTKFVLTYYGGSGMAEDPAEIEKQMAAWGTWFGGMGEAVVDGGNPFGAATSIAADGSVTDGGTIEIGGYSIIDAADLATATDMAKGCPVLANGGSVQVSEALEM